MAGNNPKKDKVNDVVEIYRGVKINRYPIILINVSVAQKKKLIDLKLDDKISAKEAIKSGKILCPCQDIKK